MGKVDPLVTMATMGKVDPLVTMATMGKVDPLITMVTMETKGWQPRGYFGYHGNHGETLIFISAMNVL